MIYITGDCHSDFRRFSTKIFTEQKEMTKDDYVIICGDFGGVWDKDEESSREKYNLDWLDSKSFTTLFIDGNHENFDRLDAFPVEEWHDGKVHKIRNSVIHLMRGQIYEIQGKSFFVFGGASSHDIDGGILELDDPDFHRRKKRLNREWIPYRINHVSWWEQEIANDAEMLEGVMNLQKHGNEVDYIITHCCATSIQALLSLGGYEPDKQTDYLEKIRQQVQYKKWFFGHYHDNKQVTADDLLLYEQIVRIL